MSKSITAAILAGGKSRRMGFDKASAEIHGEIFLARTARIATEAGLGVLVVGRPRPAEWNVGNVAFVADKWPDHGPMGGIATALIHAERPILALACDMPRLSAQALCWLADEATGRSLEYGLIAEGEAGYEPLFSVYTPACLPIMRERLTDGDRSLQSLIRAGGYTVMQAPEWVRQQLVNINTPEDLAALVNEESKHD